MAVGIRLGSITDEIGTSEFLFAFFSTIAGNLESRGWGSRFPILLKTLYGGALEQKDAIAAIAELDIVESELRRLPIAKVIWDIEDRKKAPPWGANVANHINDLSNYFVSSTGRDLIPLLRDVFEELRDRGGTATIVAY